jgi:hypothetical protein
MIEELPDGMKNPQGCFSTDGTIGTCVWEAESLDELSQFIDTALGDASEQQYFEIDEDAIVAFESLCTIDRRNACDRHGKRFQTLL